MTNRRQFIAGLLATGLAPRSTWADVGAPAFLSAAARDDGTYVLCGISAALDVLFNVPLPSRGHAAAAHPTRAIAVAFARRPGTFAHAVDCATGQVIATLDAPQGRHFHGHGAFSRDGTWLFTTENDYEAGQGRVGVWDVAAGFTRADEFSSGGVGPHDIKRVPGSDTLVIANGGIDTHPDSGRTKLNIATMRPNMTYVEDGRLVETVRLEGEHHKNSIRHLAVNADGRVAFGMQWQGGGPAPALVGLHKRGNSVQLLSVADEALRHMQGYVGSIAFAVDGAQIIATSPRGGMVQQYDTDTLTIVDQNTLADASGVATTPDGVIITTGTGKLVNLHGHHAETVENTTLRWDNHLVPLG